MKTKGGKTMNPTDAFRKEQRRKELKRNKKERKKVREVGILKKDPEAIKDQIKKLETENADGAFDKARRHKKRQLEDTLSLVLKKRKEHDEKIKENGDDGVMFSHLPAPRDEPAPPRQDLPPFPPPGEAPFRFPGLRIPESTEGMPLPPPPPPPPLPKETEKLNLSSVPVPPPPPAPLRPPPPRAPAPEESTSAEASENQNEVQKPTPAAEEKVVETTVEQPKPPPPPPPPPLLRRPPPPPPPPLAPPPPRFVYVPPPVPLMPVPVLPMVLPPPLPPPPPPLQAPSASRAPAGALNSPFYVKSAAPTATKRPLAQHTPQLTSMVPASVRVKREAPPKPLKPRSVPVPAPALAPPVVSSTSGSKPPNMDESYSAFLEDMKALGAFDEGDK